MGLSRTSRPHCASAPPAGSARLSITSERLFLSSRFEEALPKLLQAIQAETGRTVPYRYLIACYAHLGRLDEARATLARLRALTPKVVPSVAHWRSAEHRELFLSGLRLAMGEIE